MGLEKTNIGENKLRRLVYMKSLFRIGVELLRRGSEPDGALAVLIFDNCLEAMLWLLRDIYDVQIPNDKQGKYRWQLLSIIAVEMKKQSKEMLRGNESDLVQLHLTRNNIQHNGIVPSISSVEKMKVTTQLVLANVVETEFGVSWDKISLAVLIEDPIVRELYVKAEEDFHAIKHSEAALNLVAAFEFMKAKETDRRYGSGILMRRWAANKINEESQVGEVRQLASYALAIEKEVEILKLGLDYKSYQKYRDCFGIEPLDSPAFSLVETDARKILEIVREKYGLKTCFDKIAEDASESSDNERTTEELTKMGRDLLKEWLAFAFEFVIDNVLRWQSIWRFGLFEMLSYSQKDTLQNV